MPWGFKVEEEVHPARIGLQPDPLRNYSLNRGQIFWSHLLKSLSDIPRMQGGQDEKEK
jgi:hypothetical protein